jgi:hypothetical protein
MGALQTTPAHRALLPGSSGEMGELVHTKVQAVLSQYLTQASLVVALQDCYVVFTVVFVAAALASVCIPGGEEKK